MATLGDFINNLAKQAGIPADDKQLIDVLSSDAVRTTTIPDDFRVCNGIWLVKMSSQNRLSKYRIAQSVSKLLS